MYKEEGTNNGSYFSGHIYKVFVNFTTHSSTVWQATEYVSQYTNDYHNKCLKTGRVQLNHISENTLSDTCLKFTKSVAGKNMIVFINPESLF